MATELPARGFITPAESLRAQVQSTAISPALAVRRYPELAVSRVRQDQPRAPHANNGLEDPLQGASLRRGLRGRISALRIDHRTRPFAGNASQVIARARLQRDARVKAASGRASLFIRHYHPLFNGTVHRG